MSNRNQADRAAPPEKASPITAGARIRQLRLDARKGLREQAREIGISASSLSDLEKDQGGVSLRRLQQVASHFGVSVTELLDSDDEAVAPPSVPIETMSMSSLEVGLSRGTGVRYHVLGPARGHSLQPYLLSFEPGGGFADDKIAHAGEEFAYVVFGDVTLLFDGNEVHLRQGDMVRFRTDVPHAFRNTSRGCPALVIGAATPPW